MFKKVFSMVQHFFSTLAVCFICASRKKDKMYRIFCQEDNTIKLKEEKIYGKEQQETDSKI